MELYLNKLKTYREEQYRSLMRIIHLKYFEKDILQMIFYKSSFVIFKDYYILLFAKQVDTQ